MIDFFKFDPVDQPAPLFASADGLTAVHVKGPQWPLLPQSPIRQAARADAKRWTFVGEPPDGYRGIWANA